MEEVASYRVEYHKPAGSPDIMQNIINPENGLEKEQKHASTKDNV